MLDDNGDWKWICDERDINATFRAERPFCHDLKVEDGAVLIPTNFYGVRDFHVSLKKNSEPNRLIVFRVDEANLDPNQPMARGMGCGRTVIGN